MSSRPSPPRRPLPAILGATAVAAALALPAAAQDLPTARAELKDQQGRTVGNALLYETPAGVLLQASFAGLPAGVHALHIHETGACEPSFEAAGGHLSPDGRSHGYLREDGPHTGDMPNIHVPETGNLQIELMTLLDDMDAQLLDDDGAALVIHAGADDYASQPAGDAGSPIACGVIGRQGD
ncbi:superoxide dismutase family protein [Thiohalocapsa sp. ML1]|jgi:superoxide dismutase, Cu-Zn family|uniref:superoxide dismutase family protein n=1 Tax=Thiohalocapsa sp. ML1 TaxID=1431688 RepID=UPI000731F8F8|nr:superoxide dismutase family protein [Thiohalocapsa sp. ML1]